MTTPDPGDIDDVDDCDDTPKLTDEEWAAVVDLSADTESDPARPDGAA